MQVNILLYWTFKSYPKRYTWEKCFLILREFSLALHQLPASE